MSATILLSRLENVRRTDNGWRADCPNPIHSRAKGSLSIAEAGDGRVLLHCFACSDTYGILSAIGLELADLFPERMSAPSPEACRRAHEANRRGDWESALRVLEREATVVLIAAGMLCNFEPFSEADDARLTLAMQRIEDARAELA